MLSVPHTARSRSRRVRWGPREAEEGTVPEAAVAAGLPFDRTGSTRTGFLGAAGVPEHEREETTVWRWFDERLGR